MNRLELIQKLIRKRKYKYYTEIGVQNGLSFLPVSCMYKTAIDPKFNFSKKVVLEWYLKNPINFLNKYFQISSRAYFKTDHFNSKPIDICLIDGLHTFKESLNDAISILNKMSVSGIVIMHDCLPPHKAAATPGISYQDAASKGVEGW